MSKAQQLRDRLKQQLTAADQEIFELLEGLIAEYEEEIHRLKEENKGWKVLEAVFNPRVRLYKTDKQPLLVIKEEILPEHQEWNLSVDQEGIKEEEKLWISQQGEQLQQLEEADLTKFGFTAVTVKIENDDEKPHSSQLHQSRSDESTDTSGRSSDSSGTGTDDSYDWKQTRELQSHFNCRKHTNIVHSGNTEQFKVFKYGKSSGHMNNSEQHKGRQASIKPFSCSDRSKKQKQKNTLSKGMTIQTRRKQFGCSECGKRFGRKSHLNDHMIIHTGEKAFGCSECGRRFGIKSNLNRHMIIHIRQKAFVCSECGRRFEQKSHLNEHMIIHIRQKAFGCSGCGRRFGRKSTLKTHMIIHTGQNLEEIPRIQCQQCLGCNYRPPILEPIAFY